MSKENAITVEFYNRHADLYQQRNQTDYATSQGAEDDKIHRAYILQTLTDLPKNAHMFEVGSGTGRDAKLIRSMGYEIQVSDAAESFLAILEMQGFAPIKFNLITDDFSQQYDYILVNAVLVHFTKAEVRAAIQKLYQALTPGGVAAFSLKKRTNCDEEWKTNIPGTGLARYFSYWSIEEVKQLIAATGFKIELLQSNVGMRANWLDIIVKK